MSHAAKVESERMHLSELEPLMRFVSSLKGQIPDDIWEKVEALRQQWTDELLNSITVKRGEAR
jgi:basic membrane lipoprotein Med (substrate-binding protein (PBP1-ABC) superfamily)